MATKQNDPSFVVLSTHRIIFPHLDAPHKFEDEDGKEDNEPKYDCTWLIGKQHPDVGAIMLSMQAMWQAESLSKFKGMPWDMIGQPDGIWCPLRDGDAYADKMVMRGKDAALYEPYRGCYFIKATSGMEYPPVVYEQLPGQGRIEVLDIKNKIYGGCYARGVLKGLAWANKGKFGFSYFINSVLKTAEGPKLGGFSASDKDYDFGADATDASTLLPGEAPVASYGAPVAVPGGVRTMAPGLPPVMPAAQRPALPGMVPAAQPAYVAPPAQAAPPVYVSPAPQVAAVQPIYNQSDGKPIVSFDGGGNWEWVV